MDQLPDGTFRWTTPSGRSYITEPTRYPHLTRFSLHCVRWPAPQEAFVSRKLNAFKQPEPLSAMAKPAVHMKDLTRVS